LVKWFDLKNLQIGHVISEVSLLLLPRQYLSTILAFHFTGHYSIKKHLQRKTTNTSAASLVYDSGSQLVRIVTQIKVAIVLLVYPKNFAVIAHNTEQHCGFGSGFQPEESHITPGG